MWYRADSGPRRCAIIIGAASALRCQFWLRILNHFWFRIVNQFWQTFPTAPQKTFAISGYESLTSFFQAFAISG